MGYSFLVTPSSQLPSFHTLIVRSKTLNKAKKVIMDIEVFHVIFKIPNVNPYIVGTDSRFIMLCKRGSFLWSV